MMIEIGSRSATETTSMTRGCLRKERDRKKDDNQCFVSKLWFKNEDYFLVFLKFFAASKVYIHMNLIKDFRYFVNAFV